MCVYGFCKFHDVMFVDGEGIMWYLFTLIM